MNRERAKELLPIIKAYADGAEIQCSHDKDGKWLDLDPHGIDAPRWLDDLDYRIKPKPREFWIDPDDYEVWADQEPPPVPHAIKVREVLE